VLSRLDPFWTAYIGFGIICTICELVRPAHAISYRKGIPLDVVAFVAMQFAVFPLAVWVTDPMIPRIGKVVPTDLFELPLALRIVMFYLLADFGSYWMHRLMHAYAWPFHRFHHSPKQLYWFAGVRATLPQQILFNIPYVIAVPLLYHAPAWVFTLLVVEGVARNHWMHMNFAWRSNWIEWIFVTPRYHAIHHSANAMLAARDDTPPAPARRAKRARGAPAKVLPRPRPAHGNYGSLFTIWDRVFGTYLDPDTTKVKKFGLGDDKRDTVLLMIGV
jgi:sterol desaturase/sphingolipid hydroxylase (fatty acid hydroxylase superfamily)